MKDAIISDLFFNQERLTEEERTPTAIMQQATDFAQSIKTLTDGAIDIEPYKIQADYLKRL